MKRGISIVLSLGLSAGCSTTATIRRVGGQNEVRIVRGTPRDVIVDAAGFERSIRRDQIHDIDHPGNVHAVLGGVLLAYGIANIATGRPLCHERGNAFCAGLMAPAAIGVGMIAWGLAIWSKSRRAAANMGPPSPQLGLAPIFADHAGGGAGLLLRY